MTIITLLHPGEMGASIGAAAAAAGNVVRWVSAGRSDETRARAAAAGLMDAGTEGPALDGAAIVLSVCPPASALDVAAAVAATGFGGIYVDCNAISPATIREVASVVQAAGARCVDGGIIGPPAHRAGTTRLYLAGDGAEDVTKAFDGSLLDARVMTGEVGAASALKMTYAAWTKGSSALLLSVRALADAEGVSEALLAEWGLSQAGLEARSEATANGNAFKAWRFVGEMNEIAATFEAAGLPGDFHHGAAAVYERLAGFKGANSGVDVQAVSEALNGRRR